MREQNAGQEYQRLHILYVNLISSSVPREAVRRGRDQLGYELQTREARNCCTEVTALGRASPSRFIVAVRPAN